MGFLVERVAEVVVEERLLLDDLESAFEDGVNGSLVMSGKLVCESSETSRARNLIDLTNTTCIFSD